LEEIGLEKGRIRMFNLSSAMGGQFAASAAELTKEIERIGRSPLGRYAEKQVE
jgi:coenzyme F420-reducing hydrogenase delta subunit